MKNWKALLCVCVMLLLCSACGNESALVVEEVPQEAETTVIEQETEQPMPEPEETVSDLWAFAPYEAEGVWVYFPNEDGTDLASERLTDDMDLPQLIEELKQRSVLSLETAVLELIAETATEVNKDSEVLSIKPSNKERVRLNLSEEYLKTLTDLTSKEERLKVQALVNTVLKYLGADEMELLCNGASIETQWRDYQGALFFKEPK